MVMIVLLAVAFAAAADSDTTLGKCLVLSGLGLPCARHSGDSVPPRPGAAPSGSGSPPAAGSILCLRSAPWFQTEMGFQLLTTTILDLMAPYVVQKEYLQWR